LDKMSDIETEYGILVAPFVRNGSPRYTSIERH